MSRGMGWRRHLELERNIAGINTKVLVFRLKEDIFSKLKRCLLGYKFNQILSCLFREREKLLLHVVCLGKVKIERERNIVGVTMVKTFIWGVGLMRIGVRRRRHYN